MVTFEISLIKWSKRNVTEKNTCKVVFSFFLRCLLGDKGWNLVICGVGKPCFILKTDIRLIGCYHSCFLNSKCS